MYDLFENLYKGRKEDTITELMSYCLNKDEYKDEAKKYFKAILKEIAKEKYKKKYLEKKYKEKYEIDSVSYYSQQRIKISKDKTIIPDIIAIGYDKDDKPIVQIVIECKIDADFGNKKFYKIYSERVENTYLILQCPKEKKEFLRENAKEEGFYAVIDYQMFLDRFKNVDDYIVKEIIKFIKDYKDDIDNFDYTEDIDKDYNVDNYLENVKEFKVMFESILEKTENEIISEAKSYDILHVNSYKNNKNEGIFFEVTNDFLLGEWDCLISNKGKYKIPYEISDGDLIYYPERKIEKVLKKDAVKLKNIYYFLSELDRNVKLIDKNKVEKKWSCENGRTSYYWGIDEIGFEVFFDFTQKGLPLLLFWIDVKSNKEKRKSYINILELPVEKTGYDDDDYHYYSYDKLNDYFDNISIFKKYFKDMLGK